MDKDDFKNDAKYPKVGEEMKEASLNEIDDSLNSDAGFVERSAKKKNRRTV